jgi:hypothetical protein
MLKKEHRFYQSPGTSTNTQQQILHVVLPLTLEILYACVKESTTRTRHISVQSGNIYACIQGRPETHGCPKQINNLAVPNNPYMGHTAPLTSRRCILYIYSTNICTEYFKHAAHSPFFPLQNAVYFIMLTCLVPVLFAFYIQGVLKFKCKIPAPKG